MSLKVILDDGTECEIPAINKPKVFKMLLDNLEALIKTNEEWIAARERETEAIRKHIFTLRRVYDAISAVADANARISDMFPTVPISREEGDTENE